MPELTAVDILIEPDEVSTRRAREINQRMLRSVPDGVVLDATHEPHITMLPPRWPSNRAARCSISRPTSSPP